MELTIYEQTSIFLWSLVLGAVIAGIYTVIAVLRTVSPPGRYALFVTDVVFMLVCGMLNFLFALSVTGGMLRGYSLMAQLASFCLLYLTLGRLIRKSSFVICGFFKRLMHSLTAPFRRFFGRIRSVIGSKCKILLKNIKKKKISLEK